VDSPANRLGSTITAALAVQSVFTTRASGNACWIRSARDSSWSTNSLGAPEEKSNALVTSRITWPLSASTPTEDNASTAASPLVATTTASASELLTSAKPASRSCESAHSGRPAVAAGSRVPTTIW